MSSIKFNFSPKTKPFPHQIDATAYIQQRDAVALFDEQGLGKTKIVIDAICNNIREGTIDGAVVVCRKTLIQNWQEEIETHSYLKSIVLRGTVKEKGLNFMGFAHFYLINYESVIGEVGRLSMFLKTRTMAIVLDESHAIKNPESQSAKAIFKISVLAKKRIIISGTPIANKPLDIWAQFFFLDKGQLLGDNFSHFKGKYSLDIKNDSSAKSTDTLLDLKQIVIDNSIRRKKDDVLELPEKVYRDEYVQIVGKQLEMYNHLKNELCLEIETLSGDIVIDDSSDLLKKLLRLAQIASNPKLIDNSYDQEAAKFPRLRRIVAEIIKRNEKVIVWSCFVDNIRLITQAFKEFGSVMVHGEIPIDQRNKNIKRFKTDETCQVLVANPAAAKEGLTLTVANNAIYFDRNFNLVDYLQSQDRIHRISQSRPCQIIKLIAQKTIDEYIDEILQRKQAVAKFLQGDKDGIDFSDRLSKDDIIAYLGK